MVARRDHGVVEKQSAFSKLVSRAVRGMRKKNVHLNGQMCFQQAHIELINAINVAFVEAQNEVRTDGTIDGGLIVGYLASVAATAEILTYATGVNTLIESKPTPK